MGNNKLNNEDLKKIKHIIKLTNSIDSLYKKIYELELNGKKNTEEYKRNISFLDMVLESEIQTYSEIKKDPIKLKKYFEYVSNYLNYDFKDNYNTILNIDDTNRIYYRILYKIVDELKMTNYDDNDLPKNISNYIVDFIIDDHNADTILYDATILNRNIFNDILYSYIYFLNFYSYNAPKEIQLDFIKEKYNMSFINTTLENEMIENKFNIPKQIKLISKQIGNTLNIDYDDFIEINNYDIREDAIENIEKLSNISNEEFENDKIYSQIIITLSLLKSLLILLDENNTYYVEKYFLELVESNKKIDNFTNIIKIISNFLKDINIDKTKIKQLKNKQ